MTEQHFSAHGRARTGHSHQGVGHVDERHDEQFTVVGNHLAQHPELSLTAIGLAVHIQSLRSGTLVSIKALAAKFPEGETRIASALRELEAHGYLARIKERLPSGRIVTRTISYNKPRTRTAPPPPKPHSESPQAPAMPTPRPTPTQTHDLPTHRIARDVLAGLRTVDPRLHLAECDVRRLAPAVAAWLERGVAPDDVQRTLSAGMPREGVRHPAGFLAHRLTALLPPPLPPKPEAERPAPLQNCEGCDRAFRAPYQGRCRDCRTACPDRAAA
ncbi:helix-turn-helix domain-containing protein [Streptomyces sporangiiformans]|uniref:Helix-turn-helix domain-containing protein n=1 Tax=Streptomyces sporangiiformans TaxID=2315329 RepID=A0A505DCW3_9ACTN|nr:helix-turn-helix domain-containing protein [Streptomyces sporangiiformans]TPQ20352.1 helix-turn-helix domain-containing protein [Streptomyces sporangiiformans]